MIIGDIPRLNARRSPGALGVVDGGKRLTWTAVAARVERLAIALRETFALQHGDRIGVLAANCSQQVETLFACSRAGLVYVAIDPALPDTDMTALFEHADPALLLAGTAHRDTAATLGTRYGRPVIDLDGQEVGRSFERLIEEAPSRRTDRGDVDDVYSIAYTSGSTGLPKGVPHTSRTKLARICGVIHADRPRASDVQATVGPLNHQGPEYHLLTYAYVGATVVILPRFDTFSLFDAIEREGVTAVQAVPTMLKRFVDHAEHNGPPKRRLRLISYGSSRTEPEVVLHARELYQCAFTQLGGGGTEGGPALYLSQEDHELVFDQPSRRGLLNSTGRPTPGFEARIVDPSGEEVGDGEIGELALRGEAFATQYWRDDRATAAAWRDGWLYLGDLAKRDPNGYHYYVDRTNGRIKTGGKTVYASEVEVALSRHSLVREAAAFGVPSLEWGEAVHAVVVADGVTGEALRAFLRQSLPGFKVPKTIEIRSALPHTSSGKIAYGQLRDDRPAKARS